MKMFAPYCNSYSQISKTIADLDKHYIYIVSTKYKTETLVSYGYEKRRPRAARGGGLRLDNNCRRKTEDAKTMLDNKRLRALLEERESNLLDITYKQESLLPSHAENKSYNTLTGIGIMVARMNQDLE